MQLLVLVLNKVELLDPLLEKWQENDLRGATILSSTGMAHELSQNEDSPIFATLRVLLDPDRQENKTIFAVLKEEDINKAIDVTRSVVGDLTKPDTAIIFTVPVNRIEGINL